MTLFAAFFAAIFTFFHAAQANKVAQQPLPARAAFATRARDRTEVEFVLHDSAPRLTAQDVAPATPTL